MDLLWEWKSSGVDEALTQLNVKALEGTSPSEYLLYSDAIPRRNDGRISRGFLQRYAHTENGGWWCSGIDLLTGEEDTWGCFKPEFPRYSERSKPIKYEHPPLTPTGLFALKVTKDIWRQISDRGAVEFAASDIKENLPDLGFWQWLIDRSEVPLCLTEGAKKAGALLSAGYAAIALPGINNGYRTPKDNNGKRIGKSHLIPQLQKLAISGRTIYLVFDRDSKPKTVKAVNAAIKKTGYLLQQAGCQVKVVVWDSQLGKGVDDLIANCGREYFAEVYDRAPSLETWKARAWQSLTYTPQVKLCDRYLPNTEIPTQTKLIGIKSPKGTGKTKFLERIVLQARQRQQKVLVIGHRIQLVQELCQRFGLQYISEVSRDSSHKCLGYGLCIDSLHPNSQAKFNPDDWQDSLVIIDEIEQVLWHGLNSATCKDNRVEILKTFKTLMQNVLAQQGQVYVADADLSDVAIDYLISLSGIELEPYIICNEWQPDDKSFWQVYNYEGKTPKKLVEDLETYIEKGGKPFICLSAQKLTSKWGTQNLEAYLQQKFPQTRILRIDSESLADRHHPAYQCIAKLNTVLSNYDIVIVSPSIETGISIELKHHFTSVWAIAQGIQSENAVRQTLARIRDNVPRYLWCASYSFNKIGNGSTSIPALLNSSHRFTQLNIRLLQQLDLAYLDDLDTGFQAESLLCWAKMAVRYNASAIDYRGSILAALSAEGHQIIDAATVAIKEPDKKSQDTKSLVEVITEISTQNYQAECQAIAACANLSDIEYQRLNKSIVKSLSDRRKLRKYQLQQRYHLPVTSDLVALDDDGWYDKIRLHYFLTVGRSYLADRDTQVARQLIQRGNGSLFLPDFNHSQLGAVVGTMEILGIPVLLSDSSRQLRNSDRDLQALKAIAINNRSEIKTILNTGIAKNYSPITILSRIISKIDCKLKHIRSETENKKRIRVYQLETITDNRDIVFQHWLNIDRQRPGNSLFWSEDKFSSLKCSRTVQKNDSSYLQLSLNI
ncbi:plasmid replication protein, CyRepA1 family [Myxosarcina sp. GI1]|uniref:plasmid replication protein, CyRepA1 family n=1 Tax=Myxosarcina sp. GI1 TaxID=1541065 RepID=UPI000568CC11|nr:plasmid replication protein, CyRepA1 family [Myxosarcina sp. GI1]